MNDEECYLCEGTGESECPLDYGGPCPEECPSCGGEQVICCPACDGSGKN